MQHVQVIGVEALQRKFAAYSRALGRSGNEVLRPQARLLFQAVINALPPKNQKQGRGAVVRSILHAVEPTREEDWKSEKVQSLIREKDTAAFRSFLDRAGIAAEVTRFRPEEHTAKRDLHGKVKRSGRNLTLDLRDWRNYTKNVWGRVGRLKAGFLPALVACGGKAAGWISRHLGNAPGSVTDALDHPSKPFIVGRNRARGIGFFRATIEFAVRVREKSIMADMRRQLARAKREAGLKGVR